MDITRHIKMIDVEGLLLPNKPLSNVDLNDAAKKLKIKHFRGTFVRDELPRKANARECGILNTGDSATDGYHWICWFKAGKRKLAFDSYGLVPPVELIQYLKEPVYYNSERLQYGKTVFCGHLCLYVLKKLGDGCDLQDVVNSLW